MSDAVALVFGYLITGVFRIWWDWREPDWNRPSYLRAGNFLGILTVALTWAPWTVFLLWMDLRHTKDIRRETSRHLLAMWLVFGGTAILAAAL